MIDFMERFLAKAEAKTKELHTHTLKSVNPPKDISRKKIWVFDYEDDGKGNPTFVDFYDGETHHGFEFYNNKHSGDDLLHFIVSHLRDKNIVLFAHNLQYDINHLCEQIGWHIVNDMTFAGGSNLIRAKILQIPSLMDEGLELWDSTNYFAGKLSQMGDMVGIKKGDYFEASKDWNDLKNYCRTDCEILWEFLNRFQNMMIDQLQIPIKVTIGGMAMNVFRTHFLHESVLACSRDICLDAYYGGRTEVFYQGQVDEEICVSDVNSMYPYVMTWHYPDTRFLETSTIDTHEFGVGKFLVYVPENTLLPVLPVKDEDKGLWFPTGKFEGTWTYHEVRHAIEHGAKVLKEYSGSIGTNRSRPFFKDYVETFYSKRLKAKERQDPFEVSFWKLFMNNLYGKWCQHIDPERISSFKDEGFKEEFVRKIGKLYLFRGVNEDVGQNTNYMWGAYVTSYARIYLHGILHKVHQAGHQLLYCDTDSVMYAKKNETIPYTISKELGDLDEEYFVGGEFITSKGYYLFDKPKYYSYGFRIPNRGELPERIESRGTCTDTEILGTNTPEIGESYKRGIYLGQDNEGFKIQHYKLASKGVSTEHGLKFHLEGLAVVRKPMKMKTSLRKEQKPNVWVDEEKRQISDYIKRERTKSGATRPIPYQEIKPRKEAQKEQIKEINKLTENEFKIYYQEKRKKSEKNP